MWTMFYARLLPATVISLAAWMFPSTALAAQNDELWPLPGAIQAWANRPSKPGEVIGRMEIVGRISGIAGDLEPAMNLGYEDLFGSGWGVAMEGSILARGQGWDLGGFLSVGWDSFPGRKFTDDFGDSLKPDTMDIITVLVGFKGLYDLGHGFTMDTRVGLGAALYHPVDGTLILSGIPLEIEVFKATTAVAFDFGFRFGYTVDPVFFDLGLGVRLQGPPKNGDLDFNSAGPAIVALEAGVGLRF